MIIYKNFTHLNDDEIKLIWQWRNDENVAKFMKNKKILLEEHYSFVSKLSKLNDKKYFLLFKENTTIGVIYFINITQDSCEFGLYAKPNLKGVGQILMQEIKKYAFDTLKVKELKACVFKQNEKALKLYKNNDFIITKENNDFFYLNLILLQNPL